MKGWRAGRLHWFASEDRRVIDPESLDADTVFLYSIPVFDELGDGRPEEVDLVGSSKLLLTGGEVLISKLNPHISRVCVTEAHDRPTIASTEFIALRPREGTDRQYLEYWLRSELTRQRLSSSTMSVTRSHQRVRPEVLTRSAARFPPIEVQRAICKYLALELQSIDDLTARKRELIRLLEERADSYIQQSISASGLAVKGAPAVPTKRVLRKLNRPLPENAEMITAYRDGQVTSRSARRSEGYTESWTEGATLQGVRPGDVVVHGLDGFAGAIGVSDAHGVCSPIYHVCEPIDEGDPVFYGRLLRFLATSGYLGLFASSTRERAVDFRNWDLFGRIPLPQVAPEDQHMIGRAIRQLAPIKAAVERSQMLAEERKQAVITAAVTGELDIPGLVS